MLCVCVCVCVRVVCGFKNFLSFILSPTQCIIPDIKTAGSFNIDHFAVRILSSDFQNASGYVVCCVDGVAGSMLLGPVWWQDIVESHLIWWGCYHNRQCLSGLGHLAFFSLIFFFFLLGFFFFYVFLNFLLP